MTETCPLKDARALYYCGTDSGDEIPGTLPYPLLKFPVRAGDSFSQIQVSVETAIDVDGDGVREQLAVSSQVTVLGFEPVTVDAGAFAQCAKIETKTTQTATLSADKSSMQWEVSRLEWYAPHLGLVRVNETHAAGTWSSVMEFNMLAYNVGGRRSESGPPAIVERSPQGGEEHVEQTASIRIVFSEEIDRSTVNPETFTLSSPSGPITGTIGYGSKVATFTPDWTLPQGTTHTVTLGEMTDLAGNSLPASTWSFTTVATDPFPSYVAIPTGSCPEAVAIGDVNGDGRNDVVMTTSFRFDAANDFKLFVFLHEESGALAAPIKDALNAGHNAQPASVAIGDLNHDGRNDVVIGNGSNLQLFLQNRSGSLVPFTTRQTDDAHKIALADLNHDGLLDVVGIGSGTDTATVWHQTSGGTLGSPATYAVTHDGYDDLDVGDVTGDGLPDVVVMSGQGFVPNLGILAQTPAGTLAPAAYYRVGVPDAWDLTRGVAVGDVNGDLLQDVVVSYGGNRPQRERRRLSSGIGGALAPAAGISSLDCPEPVKIADVNGDGRQDIVVAHGGWRALGVYLQQEDGSLGTEVLYGLPYATHYNPDGLAVGDINGDGWNDVVIADYNHGLVLLYNQLAPPVGQILRTPVGAAKTEPLRFPGLWSRSVPTGLILR